MSMWSPVCFAIIAAIALYTFLGEFLVVSTCRPTNHSWQHLSLYRIINHMFLSYCRMPCLKVPTFFMAPPSSEGSPIRVDPKQKCHKHLLNVFIDDREFPDQSDDYNHVLHGINGGPILHKPWHPQPDLDAPMDPLYYWYGARLGGSKSNTINLILR